MEQLKQFTFYELYEDILNCLTDTQAGKMANRICAYEFEDVEPTGDMTDEEKFYWENLSEMLCEVKDIEKEDKIPKKYNYKSKHFTFLPLYYRAMKLLNDAKCGIFVKGICRYIWHTKYDIFVFLLIIFLSNLASQSPHFDSRSIVGYTLLKFIKVFLSSTKR